MHNRKYVVDFTTLLHTKRLHDGWVEEYVDNCLAVYSTLLPLVVTHYRVVSAIPFVQTWPQVLKKRGILTAVWVVGAAIVAGTVALT